MNRLNPIEVPMQPILDSIEKLANRMERVESMLLTLVQQKAVKDWYTPAELAGALGKAEFTVREWCRLGRVNAQKRECGRGNSQEWIISHEELRRIRNHGLLPFANPYRHQH